ncbi:MAG TPA: tetratricopeptide repeat protein [Kofleriaceae bacterium]
MIRVLLALALATTAAHADIWRHAIEQGSPDTQQDIYDSEMKSGDELTLQATSSAVSPENVRQLVFHAALSYHNASSAKPNAAEPYYKIGRLLYSFYFESCDGQSLQQPSPLCRAGTSPFDAKHAKEIIDAWDAFEARAPLDPRVSVERSGPSTSDFNLLFHRAVLHTRLAKTDDLVAATKDYERIIARTDLPDETVLSNLAETYMMLGHLDEAIDTYRQALRSNRNTETMYGLAVALDRDDRGDQARDLIVAQGEQSLGEFRKRVDSGLTFFVPEGEELYYFGLAYEAFGMTDKAIDAWKQYIASGAHPEFQPRAKAHLDPLVHDRNRKSLHLETPWRDFIH